MTDARMRRLAMITAVAAIAPLSVVGVALTAPSWWAGITTALGYLLTLGVLREWSLDGYPRRAIFALMIVATAWVIGALTAASPVSFVPLSLIGALLLARRARRFLWIVAFAFAVAAVGASAFLFHPLSLRLVALYIAIPFAGTLLIAAVILVSEQAWLVVRRLERAKAIEAELAVERERVRFAGDLHDIQGHSLHVIKLKAALAGRVMNGDPERAARELAEIRRLADETITETRALAYARQELNLAAEVENAKRVGEAAGIVVDTRYEQESGVAPNPLLAQVLREATTNLLRHASPTHVSVTASAGAIEVVNNGLSTEAPARTRGLARLRERVEAAGGTLDIERRSGRFTISARIDPVRIGAKIGSDG